jgi:hypothetical protein
MVLQAECRLGGVAVAGRCRWGKICGGDGGGEALALRSEAMHRRSGGGDGGVGVALMPALTAALMCELGRRSLSVVVP